MVLPGSTPFGVPAADVVLEHTLASYGVHVVREGQVTRLDDRRVSVATPGGERELDGVTYAHVVPHYRAATWVAEGGLAGTTPAGLVDVDPLTMRHRRYPAI